MGAHHGNNPTLYLPLAQKPTLSQVNSIVACGLATKAVSLGLGRHLDTLTPEDQSAVMVWTFAAFFPGLVSFACPKLAVIALLVRLLMPSRFHFCFLWFMGAAVQLAQVGTMGLLISDLAYKCHLSDSEQTQKQRGSCVPMHIQVRYYLFAGCMFILDLPVPLSPYSKFSQSMGEDADYASIHSTH